MGRFQTEEALRELYYIDDTKNTFRPMNDEEYECKRENVSRLDDELKKN